MRHNVVIPAGHIRLRPLELEDLELVYDWRNREDIRHAFINDGLIAWEGHLGWYASYLDDENDLGFVIEETETLHEAVGTAALCRIDAERRTAEFGRLMIGSLRARGRGIGLAAVNAVCEYGFGQLGLREIRLEVFERNTAAVNIYRKAGFRTVGAQASGRGPIVAMTLRNGGHHD